MPVVEWCFVWCRSWSCARCAKVGAEMGGMHPPGVPVYWMLRWTAWIHVAPAAGHGGAKVQPCLVDKSWCKTVYDTVTGPGQDMLYSRLVSLVF